MKKILLFGGALAFLSPYASYGNNPDLDENEPDSSVNEKVDCECKGKEALEGLILGIGATAVQNLGKVSVDEIVYTNNDSSINYGAGAPATRQDIVSNFVANNIHVRSDVEFTQDALFNITSLRAVREGRTELLRHRSTRVGASLLLAYLKPVGSEFSAGILFSVSYTGNSTREITGDALPGCNRAALKHNGLRPALMLLFGRFFSALHALIGLSLGGSYVHCESNTSSGNVSLKGLAPRVGAFLLKPIGKGWSCEVALNYTFLRDKTGNVHRTINPPMGGLGGAPIPAPIEETTKLRVLSRQLEARVSVVKKI